MTFIGKHNKPYSGAESFQGAVKPFTLDWKSPAVIISHSMDEKNRILHFIGIHEWRHPVVNSRGLPVVSSFILKSERSQGPVICPAFCYTCSEEPAVCQKIGSHEGSVGMSAYRNSFRIGHSHLNCLIDCCPGICNKLFDKCIVRFPAVDAHYRK